MLCIRLYLVIKYRSVKGKDTINVVLFLDEHSCIQYKYLQPIITQYFIDNKSEIWLLFLIAHSKR